MIGADPAGDSPDLAKAVKDAGFVVVQEISMTATAELADVVLPVQAFTEREGTYTSGERRVQRYYPAVPHAPGLRPDFGITGEIARRVGLILETQYAVLAFSQIADSVADYAELDYQILAQVEEQWPVIGRDDMYYGGTTYNNTQGLGVQLSNAASRGESVALSFFQPSSPKKEKGLQAVPVHRLLDQGNLMVKSKVLASRLAQLGIVLHPDDAVKLKLSFGDQANISLNGVTAKVLVDLDNSMPKGVVLVPRSLGLPISGPSTVRVKA
ncbi:MAG: molybdopterin-dependent oxidoreductase [Chloroflexota bacterium]